MDYLNQHQIECRQVNVVGNAELMQKLRDISGQVKTPTLEWNGEVLANFGVEELEEFLRDRAAIS